MPHPSDNTMPGDLRAADLHGLSRLAIQGVAETTRLVEQMHYTIARISAPIGRSAHGQTRGITGLVYRSIHGVTGLVGGSIDLAFRHFTPVANVVPGSRRRESMVAILNGIVGDHLAATDNPLAIPMRLRHRGRSLALDRSAIAATVAKPSRRLLVALHGLCMSDHCWSSDNGERAIDLPRTLAGEKGYTQLNLHYNSGRPIAANGRELAGLMERLIEQWPVPVEEVTLLGHSMGGLVSRSACHYAMERRHLWPERLRRMIFLGTPHHGSPLERAGHWVDRVLNLSPYSAPFNRLGGIRSASITDLRHGRIIDTPDGSGQADARRDEHQDKQGADRAADPPSMRACMPAHVELYAIAATTAERIDHPAARLLGDGLVPIASALGHHHDPARHLPIPVRRQRILPATSHTGLLHHPQVLQILRDWIPA